MTGKEHFRIIGAMSGTSLDGLDLALVEFYQEDAAWKFELNQTNTLIYPDTLRRSLAKGIDLEEEALKELDIALGNFIGQAIIDEFSQEKQSIDFIASHGHTIHHRPEEGYTLQIGSAKHIHEVTGIPVINNFRQADVLAGGQGAPLVPIGDRDLFADFNYALNLGGIANISYESERTRQAFDICPFNMVLNQLASRKGLAYDSDGAMAAQGIVIQDLLEQLNSITYYVKQPPKSLGFEDFKADWFPLLQSGQYSAEDLSATYVNHAANQISRFLGKQGSRVLVTGGGAFHQHFIDELKKVTATKVVVPDRQLVEYKEALIFAYLGLLRFLGKPNCLASVTGASENVRGGDLVGF